MMPLCSAFTAADKTDALAAGNIAIAKMSLRQWIGTNVALCCCRMNMPSAGRAKFANCNAHEEADSSEISRFLPLFLGKMVVLDKTEPLIFSFFIEHNAQIYVQDTKYSQSHLG